jgi:hypothetical protein
VNAIQRTLSACELCPKCSVIMLNHRCAPSAPASAPAPGPRVDASSGAGPDNLLPPYLRAFLGSSRCQRNLLLHIGMSDGGGAGGAPEAPAGGEGREDVGNVVVLRPGSLRAGSFATVRLRRLEGQTCGWKVADTVFHRLP